MYKISFNSKDLESLRSFILDGDLVQTMNNAGCSFSAMAVALQTLMDKVEELEKELLNKESE